MFAQTQHVAEAACQRLLKSSAPLLWLAISAFLVSAGSCAMSPPSRLVAGLLVPSLLAGIGAVIFGFRVALDAALFGLLADPEEISHTDFAAGMDAFRAQLAGREAPGGVLGPRYAGALRLWRRFASCLAVQTGLLAIAACLAATGVI